MSNKYDKAADLLQHAVKQDEIYLDPLPKFEKSNLKSYEDGHSIMLHGLKMKI